MSPQSTQFDYENLSEQQRLDAVNQQLFQLESQHYNTRLAIMTADSEEQVTAQQEAVSKIEQKVHKLREERDAVENHQKQMEERRRSATAEAEATDAATEAEPTTEPPKRSR